MGIEVTEGGLGEAARRVKATETTATMSFPGGTPDFAQSPLPVIHGFDDEPIATYFVRNFWDADAAIEAVHAEQVPATTWQQMVEAARPRYPNLLLPDALYLERRLGREPFDAIIRDRFNVLLGYLDAYMRGRNPDGSEGLGAREVISNYFNGERALFSPESPTNQKEHRKEMTFSDPEGGSDIFAHWHGKISHRFFRLHFDWPVNPETKKMKILYIGPKITKD
jgi:hypothetical protein